MHSILKITAALLLTALPAGVAMGQRSSDDSGYGGRSNGSFGRRSDSGSQSDSSGFGRRDFGNRDSGSRDSNSSFGKSSFGSRDSGSSSSNQPLIAPKSSGAFVAKPLPPELLVLKTRSIFSKDHRAVAEASDNPVRPAIFPSEVAKLKFDGAMREGDHYLAFIEDTGNSNTRQWVGVGQALTANGAQINDITLDHIVVEKSGTIRQIAVGENLDSGTRLANSPVPASLNSGARPNGNVTSNAATASTTGTASDEEVAEMMKRRRVEELGQ